MRGPGTQSHGGEVLKSRRTVTGSPDQRSGAEREEQIVTETVFLQPADLEELGACLSEMTEKSVILAGGTDLIIKLREQDPGPDRILDLGKVKELKEIRREGNMLFIGAMATHARIASEPLVRRYFPALALACSQVGSMQIRNKGTIGGNLGNMSPAGDMLPVLYLFHASVRILGPLMERRQISVTDLPVRPGRTSLGKKEMILGICLPLREGRRSCFVKLGGRKEVTIAEISLCVSWEEKDGFFADTEGILGAVDTKPVVVEDIGKYLDGRKVGKEERELLSKNLSGRIQKIRMERKKPPALRVTEAERLYKERAVKGVVYDVIDLMEWS